MAEHKIKLTKTAIAEFVPVPGRQVFVWDTETRGFGLRISPGGAKTYVIQRRAGTKTRRIKIGRSDDMSPEVARKEAEKVAAQFAAGKDPGREKMREARAKLTLRQAFDEYIKAPVKKGGGKGAEKKSRTRRDIEKHSSYFVDWLDLPITDIKPSMVKKRHADILSGARVTAEGPVPDAKRKGSAAQANLAMRYLRAALNHAIADTDDDDQPILALNPVSKLNKLNLWSAVPTRKRHLRPEQIGRWIAAVQNDLVGLKHERELRDVLMFYLLTGARFAEALGSEKDGYKPLSWSDVDRGRRVVTFRNTKNRTEHELPIGEWLAGMLEERRAIAGPNFVFSSATEELLTDVRGGIARVAERTGIHVTAHDLRRSFATVADSLDIGRYTVKRMLNHVSGGDVTAGYVQVDLERMREPMQRLESFMLSQAQIRPEADAHVRGWREHLLKEKVVPLRAKA